MARIRSIKPEMRRSLVVSSWPYPVRWTFVGLPGYLDDYGRGIDDVRLIKAELYPLDDDMTGRKLEQHLIAISTNGPLCRYEVAGQRYLHITSWAEHQRVSHPAASRIPPCPTHEAHQNGSGTPTDLLPNDSGTPPEPLRPSRTRAEQGAGSREQGREQGAGNARGADNRGSGPAHDLLEQHQVALGPLGPATADQLEAKVERALGNGATPQHILAGLEEWRRRPGAKPGLLPHLIEDAMRTPTNGINQAELERLAAREAQRRAAAGATR